MTISFRLITMFSSPLARLAFSSSRRTFVCRLGRGNHNVSHTKNAAGH